MTPALKAVEATKTDAAVAALIDQANQSGSGRWETVGPRVQGAGPLEGKKALGTVDQGIGTPTRPSARPPRRPSAR